MTKTQVFIVGITTSLVAGGVIYVILPPGPVLYRGLVPFTVAIFWFLLVVRDYLP